MIPCIMLNRYSSRTTDLGRQFLCERLKNAVTYDRIAGYFCSSVLEIAGETMERISDKIRIICNSGLAPEDVKVAGLADNKIKQEWGEFKPEDKFTSEWQCGGLKHLYELLSTNKMEIRVLPDGVFGLMHGKAGVITYADGHKTSFVGSMNETASAVASNYEIVWEDNDDASVNWVQDEFDYFWNHPSAVPLSKFVIEDFQRIAKRHPIDLATWRQKKADTEVLPALAAEEPVYRQEFGLWAHQKYFVMRAFNEHKTTGGARLLLADMVGLGKTLQLAMTAKLMALYGDKPILIIVPKTLLEQWQDELKTKLDMPTAIWTGRCWRDENGHDYACESIKGILKCPRKVGIISLGLISAKSEAAELLKNLRYECVILDEAHRARRRNLNEDGNRHAQPNNLLRFMNEMTFRTHSLLLATATPVQIKPIEAYDLLNILGLPPTAAKVLGDDFSEWRKDPQKGLDYVSGTITPPTSDAEMWSIMRNPFPQRSDSSLEISRIRDKLEIDDENVVLRQDFFEKQRLPIQNRIRNLYNADFIQNYNPYVRCIVRRTRDFLENTINKETGLPYLTKINVKLYGEGNSEALLLTGYMEQAYAVAQEFCEMLSKRVKGGGFMSTLLLRRIGSTMIAGENTAKKMLNWAGNTPVDGNNDYYEANFEEDDFDEEERAGANVDVRDLTQDEQEKLSFLINLLEANHDTDPKYNQLKSILQKGVEHEGAWLDKGCILFSQYFDSAKYVAELLSKDFNQIPIGLYAGGDKSGIYHDGSFTKQTKDTIKDMVKNYSLRIVVGTDAASEGLNLQMLSTLINIDLPWNPTRLEQRKGRIQRIGQVADTILIYNMRYQGSVEDKVHSKLSERLNEIFKIFGQIPEVLEDVWIAMAQNDEQKALEAINKVPQRNPFVVKYEMDIPDCGDWEKCAEVLDKQEKIKELMKGW